VRDEQIHRRVLQEVVALGRSLGLAVGGLTVSPAPGPAGNVEFLIWLRRAAAGVFDAEVAIAQALLDARELRAGH
jgi:23S rRNA (cytidine1920-2'-O)/16S rRNA (cytidine1409-2'-O)-methyltransferase